MEFSIKAAPPPRAPDTFTTIDPNGDLFLLIGAEEAAFLVCSRTVARASPVFNRMLYGVPRVVEAKPDDGRPWVVALPEDSPVHLADILHMIHGHSHNVVPARRGTTAIFNMLIIADKYVFTDGLRCMLQSWRPERHDIAAALVNKYHKLSLWWGSCTALFISWELGYLREFRQQLSIVIRTCREDANGNLVVISKSGRAHQAHDYLATIGGLQDTIASARRRQIKTLWGEVQDMKHCMHWMRDEQCETLCFGLTLKMVGLDLGQPAVPWTASGASICYLLHKLRSKAQMIDVSMPAGHSYCCPNLRVHELCDEFDALNLEQLVDMEKLQTMHDKLAKKAYDSMRRLKGEGD